MKKKKMFEYKVKQKQLEKLKETSLKNKDGLSNFVLIQNRSKEHGEFVFRVVCEHTKKPQEVSANSSHS